MAETRSTAGTPSGPPHVELLLAFTNSVDHDEKTDDLTTPGELTTWLTDRGLLGVGKASASELQEARSLRDALRQAMRGHHDGTRRAGALENSAAALPLVLDCSTEPPGLRPAQDGVPGALAQLMVAVNDAAADDTWQRLKICAADDCQWAFFDASKNRSRTWCEWGCGNKAKTRNYRARRRALSASQQEVDASL